MPHEYVRTEEFCVTHMTEHVRNMVKLIRIKRTESRRSVLLSNNILKRNAYIKNKENFGK